MISYFITMRRPPRPTRTDTLFPSTALCRSTAAERRTRRDWSGWYWTWLRPMGDAPCPVTATGCVPRDRQGAQAAGFAACPGKGPNFPERSMPIDEPPLNAFLGRPLNDMGPAMTPPLLLNGDQPGLSNALPPQPP